MMKQKSYFRHKRDLVSEEMVVALLDKPSYEFSELFPVVHEKLRARNAASGGEEMLRLRVYEKLQIFVTQGLVKKDGKKYSAVKTALRVRAAEMADAKARDQERRSSILHSE